jgi:putative redox protein
MFSIAVRGHQLLTDQPARLGGTDTACSPLELLGAALSSCVALYVHKYCEAHGLDDTDLAVEVKPFWREDPGRVGRYDVVVHIPESIPVEHHAAIEEAAQNCPVHHTLAHTPELTFGLSVPEVVGV